MSIIASYLGQAAIWKQVASTDGYPPQPVLPGTSIRVRWEAKRRLVRNAQGQEVVSEARVFCLEAVQPGEVLTYDGRDWTVITVGEAPGLDGKAQFREVAV